MVPDQYQCRLPPPPPQLDTDTSSSTTDRDRVAALLPRSGLLIAAYRCQATHPPRHLSLTFCDLLGVGRQVTGERAVCCTATDSHRCHCRGPGVVDRRVGRTSNAMEKLKLKINIRINNPVTRDELLGSQSRKGCDCLVNPTRIHSNPERETLYDRLRQCRQLQRSMFRDGTS
ncbi:hypothetical protein J6590_010938 [Homalodisca vitripennis]|nr:hypothetical protein J6590_010938 [Homalodisca vitripennis]